MDASRTDSLIQSLARVAEFLTLPTADLAELARHAVRREFEAGQMVFAEGDVWPYVLYLSSGRLTWSLTASDGRRQVLSSVASGNVVWGHTFFDDQPMPADLVAEAYAATFRWDREHLRPVLSRNPETMWEICRQLVRSMRRSRELVFSFAFQTVAQRTANLLLRWYGPKEGERVRRGLTLEDMACYVGSTPALVCKTLYRFADQGILGITRTHLEFLNLQALREVGSGLPHDGTGQTQRPGAGG